jgi:hypothetical protein
MREHSLGKNIPRASDKLQVFPEMANYRIAKAPAKMDDWIYSDKAQLDLYITSFSDATFVTITWLHTLLDAMGRHALLSAWQLVLAGRDNELPPFIGYNSDPLSSLGVKRAGIQHEESVLKPKLLSPFAFTRFVANMVWDRLWYPKEEGRMLHLPSHIFQTIRHQAFSDLDSLPTDQITPNQKTGTPFLSDGDILTAYLLRLTSRSHPSILTSQGQRQITLVNVMGMRHLLQTTHPALLPRDGAYVANCVTTIWSHFTIREFLDAPLGHVAARIRADLVRQGSRGQIEASQGLARERGGVLCGTGDMAFCTMTNWDKARLFDVDFGAAVVDSGGGQQATSTERGSNGMEGGGGDRVRARPVYIHPWATENGFKLRGSTNVVGKDGDGNYWLGAMLRSDVVERFEGEVRKEAERLDAM